MRKIIKKALRFLMWVILAITAILVAFFFLIQNDRVQTYVAQKAAAYFSRELETNVYIDKLKVVFPLDIDIKDFGIDDRRGAPIVRTEHLQFSLSSLSRKTRNMRIGRLALENPVINLVTYEGDSLMNFQFILDYFAGGEPDKTVSEPWSFKLFNASISNASFALRDFNVLPKPFGIDFNHLYLQGVHLVLSDLLFINDTLNVALHHLSANERSGFVLNRLRADLMFTPGGIFSENLIVRTPNSDLLLDLAFLFDDFSAFSSFTESIYIQADILPSEMDLTDLAFFVPDIKGMDSKFTLEGRVEGEVNNLRLKNMTINHGAFTAFKGNISLDGLPDFEETFMHINARELTTHSRDLLSFKLPSENGQKYLELPEEVKKLGYVKMKGRFTGFYNDFVSEGSFNTNLGNIDTDITLKYNFETREIVYAGELKTRHFNLGRLLDQEELLGFLNMKASVDGTGQFPSTFDAKFAAVIDSVDFMGNNLNSLLVNGELMEKQFDGSLKLTDELINLDFHGLFDFNETPPVFNFSAELKDAYLARLNLIERDSSSLISTNVEFNFTGSNLDNLHGRILINDTRYYEKGEEILMEKFALNAQPVDNGNRSLTLRSDYIDADFDGDFNYSQIYPAFRNILRYYLPSLREDEALADAEVPDQSFTSSILLKNTQPFSQIFMPDIVINEDAQIESRFISSEGILGVTARAADITLYGTNVRNWTLNLSARNNDLNLRTGASHLLITDPDEGDSFELGLEKLMVVGTFSGDSILYQITWRDPEQPDNNSGDFSGFLTFVNSPELELRITGSEFMINSMPWWFNDDNYILIDSSAIHINQLVFQSHDQKIRVHGNVSNDPVEKLSINFDKWDISNFDALLLSSGIDISGLISGNIDLMDLYNNPNLLADLAIDDFHFNQEKLGDMHLYTSWDPYTKSVWVDSQIKYTGNIGTNIPFSLQGFYYPEKENDNFDLELQLLNFKLEVAEPFLVNILSDIKGLASGSVYIKGSLSDPDISGSMALMRTEFKVDFSNTYYSLADVINIEKDRFWANNVSIYDQFGNSGVANLQFTHNSFSDWRMDLRIQANNLAGLQTTAAHSSLFYGTAFATGTFTLNGPFNDLNMDIRVRSEPRTYVAIPISFAVDVRETDFIVFVNPETETQEIAIVEEEPSSMRVNMDLDITRDAEIQIFLPYQMGNIRSTGTGNMKMHYNTVGDFTMFGDFVTNQGTFLFTLQNMINRNFNLLPGGTIRWSGDPYDADINMQAVYRTRVTLNSLPNISDGFRNTRFPVDCILTLESSLMNPEISFGIRMPNVDEEVQRQVFSAIDTTNDVIMSRQMISLLVLNSFNFSPEQGTLASTLEASTFELLSNQLNSWLSQISKDFDIGVNYRPGDQLSSEELELALSTQLFDDRVVIDGNIGMLGEHQTHQNASNIIGDINVEVKITRDGRFRVRAFNKYNNLDFSRRETAPYTQGVGAFYRREFDKLPDLWKPRRRLLYDNNWRIENNGATTSEASQEKTSDD
jgi:hypothetical protein